MPSLARFTQNSHPLRSPGACGIVGNEIVIADGLDDEDEVTTTEAPAL
jgi:hypothetical protein